MRVCKQNHNFIDALAKSPFNFKQNNIIFITIYRDDVQIFPKLLPLHFANDCFIRNYMRLFTQTGEYYRDTGNAISREQFKNDCALFAFDLTPHLNSAEDGLELIKHSNTRIAIHFANAVVQTQTQTLTIRNRSQSGNYFRLHSMNSLQIEGLLKADHGRIKREDGQTFYLTARN